MLNNAWSSASNPNEGKMLSSYRETHTALRIVKSKI